MAETRDIIDFSLAQKPVEVMKSFTDIMAQRVHDAIQDKKIEVASAMFNSNSDPETIERLKAAALTEPDEVEDADAISDLDNELMDLTDEEWAALETEDWDVEDTTDSEQNKEE